MRVKFQYEGNPGEMNLMVQVTARFELANLTGSGYRELTVR